MTESGVHFLEITTTGLWPLRQIMYVRGAAAFRSGLMMRGSGGLSACLLAWIYLSPCRGWPPEDSARDFSRRTKQRPAVSVLIMRRRSVIHILLVCFTHLAVTAAKFNGISQFLLFAAPSSGFMETFVIWKGKFVCLWPRNFKHNTAPKVSQKGILFCLLFGLIE